MPIAVTDEDFARADDIVLGHTTVIRDMVAKAIAAERERCALIADEMRQKHGSPTGGAYANGVWDQGVRIADKIRNIT